MMDKTVAFLWWEGEVQWGDADQPFSKGWKSKDYAEYTEMLEVKDIKMVCADYTWYSNGKMKKAWHWNGESWEKVRHEDLNGVYDLFRHDKEKYELKKKMEEEVGVLNDPDVTDLCQDKLKTYNKFREYVPETKRATKENMREMIQEYGKIIVKPRYGSSGEGIEILEDLDDFEGDNEWQEMLVQPFIETGKVQKLDLKGPHDLRIIIIDGKPVGSYVRVPDEGSMLSNVNQGGDIRYMKLEDVPDEALKISREVQDILDKDLFIITVDFMFDNDENPQIIELNSQPGIYYHNKDCKKEWERPWMKKVVKSIEEMIDT